MINTSNVYKEAIKKNRILHHRVEIQFQDGSSKTVEDMELLLFQILDNTSGQNSFDLGSAIAKQLNIKLSNIDGKFTGVDFDGATIKAIIGLELPDGTTEWLDRGIYTAEPGEDTGSVIAVKAYDNMIRFDKPYSLSKLSYPATLGQIVQDACSCCGVRLSGDSANFDNSRYVVDRRPNEDSLNFRDILCFVGQIACKFSRINVDGTLSLRWYDTDLLEASWIKEGIIVVPGNNNKIDVDNSRLIQITEWKNGSLLSTDDVVITGIKVNEENEGGRESSSLCGTGEYALEISGNKLVQGNGETVALYLGEKINGLRFRPLSIKCQSDPVREAGDIGLIVDLKGNYYKTVFTGVTYTANTDQTLFCGAETPTKRSATRFSEETKVYKDLRAVWSKQKTEIDKAFDDLKKAMDETQGLFPVSVKQEDGSSILYLCDKPTLGESQVVIKLNREGWGMSTDGGKTWNVGALVDGTTITKILDAVGINANWLKTGRIEIMDDDGNVIFEADIDKKSVSMNPDSVHIGDKTISEVLSDNKNMTMLLSDDYQGIPVDSSGNYKNFPSGITTTATVMYGSNDISKDCTYTVTTSSGVTGSWDKNSRTYTVTGLTTDKGWVTIRATYLSSVSVSKKFNLSKNYAGKDGADGDPGEMYYLKSSNTVIKRGADGLLYPDSITFSGYRSGTGGRPPYAGRFVIEETTDGNTWKTVYTSSTDEAEVTHLLYSAIAALNGKLLTTRSGKFLAVPRDFVELRVSLYAAGGTTQLIDRLSIPLVVDMAALTHEDIFNLLTDDGRIKGIYKEGNQLYINATYIRSLHVTGDQVDAKKLKVVNKDGSVTLYIDEDGNVEMKVSSFSIQGKTVDDIASTVATSIAEKKASNAVKGQTQEDIFNKLSKNGTIKSVTMINGELYISFDFAHGGTVKLGGANNGNGLLSILDASGNEIGYINNTGVHFNQGEFSGTVTAGTGAIAGWKIISDYLESDDGSIRLYKDGRIVFGGDAVLSANGRTPMVKYGLSIYTQRRTTKADDGTEFYDGSGELNIYGLGSTSSANTLALNMNNYSVGYVASSSMRYKTIGKTVQEEELEELYRIKVIWAKYKDDYLSEHDERYGKEMPMFLAEDIDRRFPLAVDHNEKGKAENWNYRIMIPCMFAMLKNDHEKVLALQSDNQILLSKIDALSTEVEQLKELINNISRKE